MEIVLVAQGLPFGPNTLKHKSLGGSETAALMMAKELKKAGHLVNMFCHLPPAGQADHFQSGALCEDGVRWIDFEQMGPFIQNTEVDLLIVSRNPDIFSIPHQAKKAVLWCHDLATYKEFLPRLMQHSWNFDEIWTVSEFHKNQIHEITGYPKKNIRATRNGIVDFKVKPKKIRKAKSLLYAARPERGLENLVRPGGIMEKLPKFHLEVCMYANYPEHMMPYYNQLWTWADALPNVTLLGPKTQKELRQIMSRTWMYIYPTNFEEVSCILARECMEQGLPFLTTKVAALPETLGNCGLYYDCKKEDIGSDAFCNGFAQRVQDIWYGYDFERFPEQASGPHKGPYEWAEANLKSLARLDLYWPEVAEQWISWANPPTPSDYSMIRSMIEDSDIIPAIAYLNTITEKGKGVKKLEAELEHLYPFLFGKETFAEYYDRCYRDLEDAKNDGKGARPNPVTQTNMRYTQRFGQIALHLSKLPEGSKVFDYGCAEGTILLNLATLYPQHQFYGVDFVHSNVMLCKKYAKELKLTNAQFEHGSADKMPFGGGFDAVICSEVLEHVEKPWELMLQVEKQAKIGGKCIITVPQGPWEANGLYDKVQWHWRNHIWHINKEMIRTMFRGKQNMSMSSLTDGFAADGRALGHLCLAYDADHKNLHKVDALEKAKNHRCRQTLAVCLIAKNEEANILKCLNSIQREAHIVQVALAKSSDHTEEYLNVWAEEHPWIDFRIVKVPDIEVKKFGFDDARNESIKDVDADWIFWIDADEYLSGAILPHLKNNCFDSYALHQHHFTCDPRGAPAQLDKPARLFRNNIGFKFYGKVHEHAEIKFNEGPGFTMIMHTTDIGHTGYVNETVRRERFNRNYPLLEWDQKTYPERKLGKYLWLRDMIHRMRLIHQQGNTHEARRLAEDAILFYKENVEVFKGVGNNQALSYFSEAMAYTGKGMPVAITLNIEGHQASYEGIFEDTEQAFELGKAAIEEEFRKRKSGYWH